MLDGGEQRVLPPTAAGLSLWLRKSKRVLQLVACSASVGTSLDPHTVDSGGAKGSLGTGTSPSQEAIKLREESSGCTEVQSGPHLSDPAKHRPSCQAAAETGCSVFQLQPPNDQATVLHSAHGVSHSQALPVCRRGTPQHKQ